MDDATWAVYIDTPAMIVAGPLDEGLEPAGAIGSNWLPGHTRGQAEAIVADCLARGYSRGGADRNPRF